jgi:predicted alternative tryptophan synthase beta-subunit
MKIFDFLYKRYSYGLWFVPLILFFSGLRYHSGGNGMGELIAAGAIVVIFLVLDAIYKHESRKKW